MEKNQTNQSNKSKRTVGEVLAVLRKYDISQKSDAHSIRLALEELGPTFVKLGQLLATQSDVFPLELCGELRGIRDEVAPMTMEEIDRILLETYGKPKEEVFSYFEEEAHGSASISQVHRATLRSGEDVAVKIQRTGALESMQEDIAFIRSAAKKIPFLRKNPYMSINELVDELSEIAYNELDFTHEAANLIRFRELNEDVKYVSCPLVYQEYTKANVLVMEYIDGLKLSDKEALEEKGYDIDEIGQKYIRSYLKQVFEDGFFQAEPQQGNIKIRGGQIVWYDLGMMGEFTERNRNSFSDLIESFVTADAAKGYDAYMKMCTFPKKVDKEALFKDISELVDTISSADFEKLDMNQEMRELMRLAKKHNGRFDRTHTMVVRGIDTIKSTAEEVFPELDFFTEVKNYAVDLKMAESRNQKKDREIELLRKRAKLNKIKSIPENMASMVEQYSKGLAPVKLEMGVPDKTQPFITNIVRMLVDAFIIVALLVSSSIIVLSGMKPLVWGMPLLGFIGYSISILMIVINIIKRILRR